MSTMMNGIPEFALIDDSHDPQLRSWVQSANADGCEFPIQNLPQAFFRRAGSSEAFRPGAAIGDQLVDLLAAREAGVLVGDAAQALDGTEHGTLNTLMGRGRPNGETRTFLEDGDTVTRRGWCERAGAKRIGFGDCSAAVLPASGRP